MTLTRYRQTLLALFVCAFALVFTDSASAAPGWLAPVDLSASGQDAEEVQVAMTPDGEAVAIWVRSDGQNTIVEASAHPVAGEWSQPMKLSAAGENASEPQVAIDPAGEATAVWLRFEEANPKTIAETASRPRGGEWSASRKLSAEKLNAQQPQVAVDPAGEAVVLWSGEEPQGSIVRAVARPPGGDWSPIEKLLVPASHEPAFEPRLAINDMGEAVAVWIRFVGNPGNDRTEEASRPQGQGWSQPVKLSEAGQDSFEPTVALSPDGEAAAIWQGSDGQSQIIESSSRALGHAWSAAKKLSNPGENASSPSIAVDSADATVALWNRKDDLGGDVAESASRLAGGGWSPVIKLTAIGQESGVGNVVTDPGGEATAVWRRFEGKSRVIESATSQIGGGWSSPVQISSSEKSADFPVVAIDSAGEALAAWSCSDGTKMLVEAASFDRLPPTIQSLSAPTSGTAGVPLHFSVSAIDNWPPLGTVTWGFGDGGSASGAGVTHTFATAGDFKVSVSVPDAVGNTVTQSATVHIAASSTPPRGHPKASSARLVMVRGKFALLKLTCPGPSAARCVGVAKLTARGPKPKRRTTVLARGAFSLAGGKTVTVKLKLSGAGKRVAIPQQGLKAKLLGAGLTSRTVLVKAVHGRGHV